MNILQQIVMFSGILGAIGTVFIFFQWAIETGPLPSTWKTVSKYTLLALLCAVQMPIVLIICFIIKANS